MSWKKNAAFVLAAAAAVCFAAAVGWEEPPFPVAPEQPPVIQAETVLPEPVAVVEPVPEPEPVYDYTLPAPESPAVEKDYFADAAFYGKNPEHFQDHILRADSRPQASRKFHTDD